ncbi:Hypothetical protein A7982_07348 [Minicystis rosea]|nr:Hypothetical protein A7982_07348 [Minicystis rosea]
MPGDSAKHERMVRHCGRSVAVSRGVRADRADYLSVRTPLEMPRKRISRADVLVSR